MKDLESVCKVAVVQATPVMFQKEKCVEKVLRLMEECAASGAQLIVFPELFIPGYPYGMTYGFTVGSRNQAGREDWKAYYDNSILARGGGNAADHRLRQGVGRLCEHRLFRKG